MRFVSYRYRRASARTLPLASAHNPRVLTFRSLADARALRGRLRPGARLAVMGGLIGLEVAAAATKLGCCVTVLEMSERVMARWVPSMIGARIESWYRLPAFGSGWPAQYAM
ncbi:FAD-dependent oxidoreductase [Bradyrhizobium sp. WSM 1738]|uniref:FAD-dependent oxidoreductase n=1 Tax=Bradyrhizobium hereditatis TaxID=2821405 RepID=UPI0035E33FF8|nr:FAD-dependent oxidoreductase [Bradyrhizobium hereditatis]